MFKNIKNLNFRGMESPKCEKNSEEIPESLTFLLGEGITSHHQKIKIFPPIEGKKLFPGHLYPANF